MVTITNLTTIKPHFKNLPEVWGMTFEVFINSNWGLFENSFKGCYLQKTGRKYFDSCVNIAECGDIIAEAVLDILTTFAYEQVLDRDDEPGFDWASIRCECRDNYWGILTTIKEYFDSLN